jgi:hypothetical protein
MENLDDEQDVRGDGGMGARQRNEHAAAADSQLGYAGRTPHQHAFKQRPDLFAKDLTVRVPAGTYGWWPISLVIPPLSKSESKSQSQSEVPHTRAPTAQTATLFVLMRGASGTLWFDDFQLSPLTNSESDTRKTGRTEAVQTRPNATGAQLRSKAQDAHVLTSDHLVGRHGAIMVERFYKKARQPADAAAVTLVTQLTLGRFAALKAQLHAWRSFMSVVVLVGADGGDLLQLEEWWEHDDDARNKVLIFLFSVLPLVLLLFVCLCLICFVSLEQRINRLGEEISSEVREREKEARSGEGPSCDERNKAPFVDE